MKEVLTAILAKAITGSIAQSIVDNFILAEQSLVLGDWKKVGMAAGHFAEGVVRILEEQLEGKHTPIGKSLKPLNEHRLSGFSSKAGPDTLRFHIPRALFLVYGIRNKKGIGHLSLHEAERHDAHFLAETLRWTIISLVNIFSNLSAEETEELATNVNERRIEALWKTQTVTRVLDPKMNLDKQICIVAYAEGGKTTEDYLVSSTERGRAYVRKVARKMHQERVVEFNSVEGTVELTPIGIQKAESILKYSAPKS